MFLLSVIIAIVFHYSSFLFTNFRIPKLLQITVGLLKASVSDYAYMQQVFDRWNTFPLAKPKVFKKP